MKYVDEFRDRQKAQALTAEIERLVSRIEVARHRPLHIMEVCGGHTHSIFRYGIEGMLPQEIELIHGPGCPVCVLPMGRIDDCIAIAERPGVIFTSFGDAMRVPGSKKSLLQAKADGADVRMVYSPIDALALARKNPDREVVFFAIGFETTMPSTALTILQAERDGVRNFSVFCNHITIVPTIKAVLDSPDLHLDGFLGPGHVAMVIGTVPFEFVARYYRKPMVVAGFEPLDVLQSIWMVLRQIAEGRCEIENQYARIVPEAGNTPALRAVSRVYELREFFEWRGLGSIDHSGIRIRAGLCPVRCRAEIRHPEPQDRRPQILPVRRGAEGRHQAVAVQGVRHRLHAGAAARRADGVVGRRLRRLLPIWRHPPGQRGVSVATPARPRRLGRLHVPKVTLAHGGGGKAMKDLIDDVFVRAFDNPALAPLEDQARFDLARLAAARRPARLHHRRLCRRPAVLPRRRYRQARGLWHGQRSRGRRCGAALSVLRRRSSRRACRSICCAGSRSSMAGAAREAGVEIVTGDTKVVDKGACDQLFITTAGIGVIRPGLELGAGRARARRQWFWSTACSAITGRRSSARAAIWRLETPIESDCAPLHRLIAALLAAAPDTRFIRDATRGGVATVLNEIAEASQAAIEIDEAADPVARRGQRVLRDPGARPALPRQ